MFKHILNYLQNGYVHITLKELPPPPDFPPSKVRLELSVLDTGKVAVLLVIDSIF